jgi:hypothetical protein
MAEMLTLFGRNVTEICCVAKVKFVPFGTMVYLRSAHRFVSGIAPESRRFGLKAAYNGRVTAAADDDRGNQGGAWLRQVWP